MADASEIEWLFDAEGRKGASWNPVKGCDEKSAGCRNCYAAQMASRFNKPGQWGHGLAIWDGDKKRAVWTGQVNLVEAELDKPLRWSRKPRRIFVCSGADLFHKKVTPEFLVRVFQTVLDCQAKGRGHKFIFLTKRAKRMRDAMCRLYVSQDLKVVRWWDGDPAELQKAPEFCEYVGHRLQNSIFGVSVEDQPRVYRASLLVDTPVRKRWVSAEPLLGPVDLRPWLSEIDWVVSGGESGVNARPCALEWIERVMLDCMAAGVPVFNKQLGAFVVRERDGYPTLEAARRADPDAKHRFGDQRGTFSRGKGGDPKEWPEQLQWRQNEDGKILLKPKTPISDLTPLSYPL